ncbi:peroxin [Scheffersomyces spartinae]|uniref:Peroxin-3 n=1 Tax=Scheffersomyces spartinae TaxID=45513 RepID=A0A9P8AJX9_9ASCO|nr:peroxin [Scheffersomyces spartinae]KAG7195329.1 peroxin [Scheffersomyces spartinae]
MPIFSSISSFFNRNKKRLLIAGGLTVSAYYLVDHFVLQKFRDFQNNLKQEMLFKEQIRRRFLQTQQDCHYTILALLPVLTDPVIEYLPVELIAQALKVKKNNNNNSQQQLSSSNELTDSMLTTDNLNIHENTENQQLQQYMGHLKTQLWNLLKIKTLTRSLSLLYSISGLLLITRLQLNILARRSYLELAIVMAGGKLPANENNQANYQIEQSYLSLSWWLLNNGWLAITKMIEDLVIEKFSTINARTEVLLSDFNGILSEINQSIQQEHSQEIVACLFPNNYDNLITTLLNTNPNLVSELDMSDSNFHKLISETNFLVNSDYFSELFFKLIKNSQETLFSNLCLFLNSTVQPDKFELINENKKYKLANYLAQLSVQNGIMVDNNHEVNEFDDIGTELSGNIYINGLNAMEELDEFSASIYSNFE